MSDDATSAARPGSGVDLSRRIDRLETLHESLAKEVGGLSTTIARVELNQSHAEELHKLRYDSTAQALSQLEGEVKQGGDRLASFIDRMEKIMSGETATQQGRAGQQLVEDYQSWRKTVEDRFDAAETLAVQVRLLGRLGMLLVGGSVVTTALAVYAALNGAGV
jgi:uncharacterized protein YukE